MAIPDPQGEGPRPEASGNRKRSGPVYWEADDRRNRPWQDAENGVFEHPGRGLGTTIETEKHTAMNDNQGPYITALLCEKVLEEKDGIKSAVRLIDRITHVRVGQDVPSTLPPFDYPISLMIKLKSGQARGTYSIVVHLVKPSGESREVVRRAVNFEGDDDRGIDIVGQLGLRIEMTGLYWFEICLEDRGRSEVLTRLPLRVVYLPQTQPRSGESSSGGDLQGNN